MQVPITKTENEPDPHLMYIELHQFTPDEYLTSEPLDPKPLFMCYRKIAQIPVKSV